MSQYDFRTLNDKEFEVFCVDLIGDVEKKRFERFKPGRDSGVDGRFFAPDGSEVVLQCKHWPGSPLEQLIRRLQVDELPKIRKLDPSRYILAVSHPLSRRDKAVIQQALAPFIKTPTDILGYEDLNDLLSTRPEIERRHYKLWLLSVNVLGQIVNRAIFDRSDFTVTEARDFAKKYVYTKNHEEAISKLERNRVLIITGDAGVGKTTLAQHVCLGYVADQYEMIQIAEEIEEAESVLRRDERQILYFDDFLGRNYLEALSGHEGNRIVQLIRRIANDPLKRFVLTSRNTILNQGKLLIDSFQTGKTEKNEFELTLRSFDDMDKARILYNHLWHSDLPVEFIEQLYEGKRYREVIRHRGFNPRLISFVTDADRLTQVPADEYWSYIESALTNPADVWENPFVAQQDDFGRSIVLLVALNRRPIREEELGEAYARYVSIPQNAGMQGRREYLINVRHLVGSLLSRTIGDSTSGALIDLFNPSLGDYVLRRYAADVTTLMNGFLSLRSVESLRTLDSLKTNELLSRSSYASIIAAVVRSADSSKFIGYSAQYVAEACQEWRVMGAGTPDEEALLARCFAFVNSEPLPNTFDSTAKLLHWARTHGLASNAMISNFIEQAAELNPSNYELRALIDLADLIDSDDQLKGDAMAQITNAFVGGLCDDIQSEIDPTDVFSDLDEYESYEATKKVEGMVVDKASEMGLTLESDDVNAIVDSYDVRSAMHDFFSGARYSSTAVPTQFVSPFQEIDDLFDRA